MKLFLIVLALIAKQTLVKGRSTTPSTVDILFGSSQVDVGHVSKNEYPFMAALMYKSGNLLCGGSLIDEKHILTAAHCVSGNHIDLEDIIVYLGAHNITSGNHWSEHMVKTVIKHEGYIDGKNGRNENDIAILELATPVEFSDAIKPILLPSLDESFTNILMTVAGYGNFRSGERSKQQLQKVVVNTMPNSNCSDAYQNSRHRISSTMICAQSIHDGRDAFIGNGGSPMFIAREDTNFVQLGIVSFGPSRFSSTHPSVYTRITKYMQWIEKNLQGPPYISAVITSVNDSKDEKPVSECSKSCEWPALDDILSGSTEAIAKYKECYEKNQYHMTADNISNYENVITTTEKDPR